MNDLVEVEVKTTATIRAGKLPKGVTGPLKEFVEATLPVLKEAVKDYFEEGKGEEK